MLKLNTSKETGSEIQELIKRYQTLSCDEFLIQLSDLKSAKQIKLTWEEIAKAYHAAGGEKIAESTVRKRYKNHKKNINKPQEELKAPFLAQVEPVDELYPAPTKEVEKFQAQDKKREARSLQRNQARVDNLLRNLVDSFQEVMKKEKPFIPQPQVNNEFTDTALTLLLSDLHRGMVTENHWNKFNDVEFDKRMLQVVEEVIQYQGLTKAKELHIMQLGDLIEGNLHRLTKIKETENAVQQTQIVAEILSEVVKLLSPYFNTVHVYSVKGNHDRTSSRKEEEIRTESFHEFVVWYMKARLENFENVEFHNNEYDDEIIVAEILGNTYFGVHGHLESYANTPQSLSMMVKKFPTAVFAGHIHKNFENEMFGVDLIVNGGFAGTNDYAKDKRLYSKAHQKLLWLTDEGRKATFYITFKSERG